MYVGRMAGRVVCVARKRTISTGQIEMQVTEGYPGGDIQKQVKVEH